MKTIGNYRAKTHLSHYLVEDQKGNTVVAELVPARREDNRARPKVGEIEGEPFELPREAFAPLRKRELNEWGL